MKPFKRLMAVMAGVVALLPLSVAFVQAQGNVQLKVLCWNILSFEGTNKEYLYNTAPYVEMLKYYDPDVICLQEFETDNTYITYPPSMEAVEKLGELASKLGMYPYFGRSYDKGDHPAHTGKDGYYGNVILSKYPIVRSHSEQLYFIGWDQWATTGSDQRSFQYVEILVPTDSKPRGARVRIVNTHLDHKRDQGTQAQNIVDRAFDPETPALLMGDMNQNGSSAAIATIRTKCDDVGANSIDWIFSYPRGAWQVDGFTVLQNNATPGPSGYPDLSKMSDHRPLICTVTIK